MRGFCGWVGVGVGVMVRNLKLVGFGSVGGMCRI